MVNKYNDKNLIQADNIKLKVCPLKSWWTHDKKTCVYDKDLFIFILLLIHLSSHVAKLVKVPQEDWHTNQQIHKEKTEQCYAFDCKDIAMYFWSHQTDWS